jgi:hypothetical protein
MTIDISTHDALRSEYLYTFGAIALATIIAVGLVVSCERMLWVLCATVLLVPYMIGVFSAAFLWNESGNQRLYIRFAHGKDSPTVFTNIELQLTILFVINCLGIVGLAYFYYADPYLGLIIAGLLFFTFVQQLLLISAINRSATMYVAPIFFVLMAFILPVMYCRYKEKWFDVSVLDKLDVNGYPLPEYKEEILKHFRARGEFRVEKSTRHIGDAIL